MSDASRIRVLLIDDDEAAHAIIRALLEQIPWATFELDSAATFEEGAEQIAQGEHDVYLVDYVLGQESGIDLVRRARQEGNRAPMILVTGKGHYTVDVEAMEAGVSDYLDKETLDPDRMERSIRYAIERARSEAALRDSEARHRSMFDNVPIGLYRTTIHGELLDANPALIQLLGHPDRDSLDFGYARNFFVNPAHRQAFLSRLDQFGVVRGFESHLARPDGRVVRIRTAARAHRDEVGQTLYIEGAVEDMSEEVEARDLHGKAARYSWIYGGSGVALVVTDLDGMILDANPAFLRTFGYDYDEVRGRMFKSLALDTDQGAVASELARLVADDTDVVESQRRFSAADDTVIWAKIRAGTVRNSRGFPDHLLVLLEDLAEA